ncbi:MAG: rhodanese-like domain-containing protein [Bacteroidia bacterium]
MIKKSGILFLFIAVFFTSCAQEKDYHTMLKLLYKNTVPIVKPEQASFEMKRDSTIVILDTREKEEYTISHIGNAKYVGYDHFEIDSLKNIPKNTRIIVYCSVGYRSERIGEKLLKTGYANVNNLYGGIFEWVNNEYPVVDMNNKPTKKVHAYSKLWGKWLIKGEKVYGN